MTRFPVTQLSCNTHFYLVIHFFRVDRLPCKWNIVLWFTHTQSASRALGASSGHQEEDLRAGLPTLFSVSNLAHLFPPVLMHNVWFGMVCGFWIGLQIELFSKWISFRRHWTLLLLVLAPPHPHCVKSSHLPLSSISVCVFKWQKICRRSIWVRLASPPLHVFISMNPS